MRRALIYMSLGIAWVLAVVGLALAIAGAVGCKGTIKRNVEDTFVDDPIQPQKFPLLIAADPHLNRDVLEAAIDLYRRAAGCELFAIAGAGVEPDVVIDFDAPPPETGQCAKMCDPRYHPACTCFGVDGWAIYYPSPSTIDVDLWVVAHELAHVLALAHDPGRRNAVTRPDAHNGPRDGAMLLVTTKDSAALKDAYCRRTP